MSIRNQSNSHAYSCEYCNGPRTQEGVEGSFCSKECHHSHEGQKLLNTLENDHCTCANCGSILKTIEKPKPERAFDHTGTGWTLNREKNRWELEWYGQEETQKAAVGFQHRTIKAEIGEIGDHTGTICGNCGNCTLSRPFPETQDRFQLEYASGILDTIREKREEGTHSKGINAEQFFHALVETQDIPLALGRAIE